MSYRDVIGHQKVKDNFKRALLQNKLASSYLFCGPEGVGKLRFAWELAKGVQCIGGEGEPCDICPSCRKAEHGNHSDIAFYEPPEGKLIFPLDTIRQIQKEISYTPLEGRYRVAILNEVHRMNAEAANGFLKTLEEPSEKALLILITPNIASLLPTIISRCQRIRFAPLTAEEIEGFLLKEGIDKNLAPLYAASSMGSIHRAQELAQENWVESRNSLLEIFLNLPRWEPVEISQKVLALLEKIPSENKRKSLVGLLEIWTTLLRDTVLTHLSSSLPLLHRDCQEKIESFHAYSAEQILEMLEVVNTHKLQVEKNFHIELLVDQLAIELKEI